VETQSGLPVLVIVSGRPGSGKSTLARRLADTLRCPLVSRDEIYEGMLRTFAHDAAPPGEVVKRAFDTFFSTIDLLVSSKVTIVAEAAFQDMRWRVGIEPLLPQVDARIVHCVVDTEVARNRVVTRRRRERRSEPDLSSGSPIVRPFEPVSLPVPAMTVSTLNGYHPELAEIVAFLQAPSRRGRTPPTV
jgi:predicted kinase